MIEAWNGGFTFICVTSGEAPNPEPGGRTAGDGLADTGTAVTVIALLGAIMLVAAGLFGGALGAHPAGAPRRYRRS